MGKGSKKTIRQHYVPRMYLRHFLSDIENEKIFAYNKIEDKILRNINIMNVAQEKYFYDLDGDDDQPIEKAFSFLEAVTADLFRSIIVKYYMTPDLNKLGLIFSEEERGNMSVFIAYQLLRTKNMRNLLTEMTEKAATAFAKYHFPPGTLDGLKISLKSSSHSYNHAKVMFDNELCIKLAQIISQHNWYIGVNTSDNPFYTSDNPVVMFNHFSKQLAVGGLAAPGMEMAMPLNSDLILIMRDSSFDRWNLSLENHFINLNPDFTEIYNTWQVISSERMIFCKKENFNLAKRIAKNNKTRIIAYDENYYDQKVKKFFRK